MQLVLQHKSGDNRLTNHKLKWGNKHEQLRQAGALIKEKRYEEARDILEGIAGHPTAQKWLAKLDEVAPKTKRKFQDDNDDPFGGIGDDYPREREKNKLGGLLYSPTQGDPNQAPYKDYTGISILIFFLYWLLWLPGIAANLYYTQINYTLLLSLLWFLPFSAHIGWHLGERIGLKIAKHRRPAINAKSKELGKK